MRLTVEMDDRKFAIEASDGLDIWEMGEILRTLLYAMTYSDETINKILR